MIGGMELVARPDLAWPNIGGICFYLQRPYLKYAKGVCSLLMGNCSQALTAVCLPRCILVSVVFPAPNNSRLVRPWASKFRRFGYREFAVRRRALW